MRQHDVAFLSNEQRSVTVSADDPGVLFGYPVAAVVPVEIELSRRVGGGREPVVNGAGLWVSLLGHSGNLRNY